MQRLLVLLRMLAPFVARDVREQYAGSRLGVTWTVLQPTLLVLLYWWVFSAILQTRLPPLANGDEVPFLAFLLASLLPWFAFNDGLLRGAGAILAKRDVVKHLAFPLQLFPLSAVAAAYVTHGTGYLLFLVGYFLWRGHLAPGQVAAILTVLFLQVLATGGLALMLSALTVYLRDVQQILGLVLQVVFYTAPILYPMELVPESLRVLVQLNPFASFALSYQTAILGATWPDGALLFQMGLFATLSLLLGRYLFRRLKPGFSDVL